MKLLGLTGNIASGKSTVLDMLRAKGASVLDADKVVHTFLGPDHPISAQVIDVFGPHIRAPQGGIDRPALGAIVFNDPSALQRLEAILHPAVGQAIRDQIAHLQASPSPPPALVVEAVKLVENRSHKLMDQLWIVIANPEVQRQRLITQRGLTPEAAQARLAAQPDSAPKRAIADLVIENNGSLADLQRQVDAGWAALLAKETNT